jgi:hypothetical protein
LNKTLDRNFSWVSTLLIVLWYQDIPVKAQDVISDSMVSERIQVIQKMLNDGKKGANLWWYSWFVGYNVATLAQGAVVITSDKLATRQDWTLGAISTVLGATGLLIAPMTPGYTSNRLEEMPERTPEEKILKLLEAEKLLENCALREKSGRSWRTHALDGAVNVGCGAVMWFGFKRTFIQGATNIAMNTAICEAQIFTQPTRAIRDFNTYCRKYKPEESKAYAPPMVDWYFTMIPGGIGIKMVF